MNRTLSRCLVPGLAAATAVVAVGAFGFGGVGGPDCVGAQGPDVAQRIDCGAAGAPEVPSACAATAGFRSVAVKPRGGGLRFSFKRRVGAKATVDLFQQSSGRRVLDRRVALFKNGTSTFNFNGKKGGDGVYIVRFRVPFGSGRTDVRRLAVERRNGVFKARPDYYRRANCDSLTSFKLERPVFGGTKARALNIAYRLGRSGKVSVKVLIGNKAFKTLPAGQRVAGKTYRLKLSSAGLPRGDVKIRLKVGATTSTLVSRRL